MEQNEMDIFGGCEIVPVENAMDLSNSRRFTKLDMTKGQQMQVTALANMLPTILSAKSASNCFYVSLPAGVSIDDLIHYADGGLGSIIMGEHGFKGHVSFHQLVEHPSVLTTFAVMSMVTNQYFLAQINNNLTKISASIDKILSFLYGEMRAELLAEVRLVKLAQKNYHSIMAHSEQRTATLITLQEAKKIAMKDIEFYLADMEEKTGNKKGTDISTVVWDMVKGKECVDLSSQLYTMSCLLEVFYSQNFDVHYISYVKAEALELLGICDRRLLTIFTTIQNDIQKVKDGLMSRVSRTGLKRETDAVNDILMELQSYAASPLTQTMNMALDEVVKEKQYYLNKDGEVYLKAS